MLNLLQSEMTTFILDWRRNNMIIDIDENELQSITTLIKDNNQYNDDLETIDFWNRIVQKLHLANCQP